MKVYIVYRNSLEGPGAPWKVFKTKEKADKWVEDNPPDDLELDPWAIAEKTVE